MELAQNVIHSNNDTDKYFVIRVWYFDYRDNDKYQYNIVSDKSYSMDKALNVKIAQEIMETNPSISYKLQKVNLLNLEKSSLAS
mgnify:FL=1